ncbi:olfactory receptor 11G2-like [Hemicordylus capensis]|uniref:olfactory receptor 11G2-like n=1 Tax=Hemicordylus capensis TaxID=884348 RepID=UPI002302744E|nr:olfactory receptor 11G2-like [Hemicordylus capensis]XP_053120214.1 olfactory receptor 11G2-like [Hemicordylus capensis]
MDSANGTGIKEFILLGFGDGQQKRFLLFIFLMIAYVLTLTENIAVITVVLLDDHLARLPMYILLGNFSWLEVCYVTTTVPRMLFDLISSHRTISFHACFLQLYIFFSLGSTECFFLSAMALDRYLAICHPLRYPQLMSPNSCYILVATCWVIGFLFHAVLVILISELSFCSSNIIDHFVCDPRPILFLACPPLGNVPIIHQITTSAGIILNIFIVLISYGVVILNLIKVSNQDSRRKAFSTISVHLMVVALFYGSITGMYSTSVGENQSEVTKAVTLFYTVITPFLNPFIYCLRNDQVKDALCRLLRRKERWMRRKETV